jgi:hypothetical protein
LFISALGFPAGGIFYAWRTLMNIINTPEALAHVLASPLDPLLQRLLRQRVEQLTDEGYDPFGLVTFAVVEPGDRLDALEAALSLPIVINLVDGSRYGSDTDYTPSAEWIADHGGLFELVYVLSDDGAGVAIFVPDRDGIDPVLLSLCRTFAEGSPCN